MDEHAHSKSALEFDGFARHVAGQLDLDASALTKDARVTDDLGLDSIGVFELVMVVEDLGVDLGDEELDGLTTVADWYDAYRLGLAGR
jgi:acyl carrier protein